MQLVDIPIDHIEAAEWNPNVMVESSLARLKQSIQRFGLVAPLVVRRIGDGRYQTIGGAQRLQVLREFGLATVSCVMVEADDVNARLLAQSLNRIQGEDDLGLKAQLLKDVLAQIPEADVLSLLPETTQSLQALASLGQQDMAGYLQNFQQSQFARLKHLTFQNTPAQLEVIEEALARVMPEVKGASTDNPNPRGNALYIICKAYLELAGREP
jgi:ParB family chromosome partitioning protein